MGLVAISSVSVSITKVVKLLKVFIILLITCIGVFYCAGSVPTNLTAQQNGINSVLVSWTAPSPSPSMGYRIRIDSTEFSADINVTSSATSRTISLQPGVHNIRIRASSLHYPSDDVETVAVTVKGMYI